MNDYHPPLHFSTIILKLNSLHCFTQSLIIMINHLNFIHFIHFIKFINSMAFMAHK